MIAWPFTGVQRLIENWQNMKIECIIEYARKLFDSMTIMLLVAIDDGVIVDIDEIVVTVGKAKIIEENVLLDVVDTGESREGV